MTPTPHTPPRSSSPGAATSPSGEILPAAGAFPISEAREAELLRAVPTLRCTAELDGFRAQLRDQGETPTAALEAALVRQAEKLK
mgnify:CR=1 FL=1